MRTKFIFTILSFLIAVTLNGQTLTTDYVITDAGQIRQLITNQGLLWFGGYSIPVIINAEFPPGSFEEHIGEAGIWVGAITPQNDTLVSVTSSWNPHISQGGAFEFWPPTGEEWDSIWVVQRGEIADIPYLHGYKGLADKDYVFRYNDYNPVSLKVKNHHPLFVDVIQIAHTWSAPDVLAQVIVYEYYIIPTKFTLKETYITQWVDPNVGLRSTDFLSMLADDYSVYYPKLNMAMGVDAPGGPDGDSYSPVGFKIFPPDDVPPSAINWTFIWNGSPNPPGLTPAKDSDKYSELMKSRLIMDNQQTATGSHFVLSFGSFNLSVGDTLHFFTAEVMGNGIEGTLSNAKSLELLKEKNFQVPGPPPRPPLIVTTDNHKVTLSWYPTDKVNPEEYYDPNRADGDNKPFAGYRVYKSENSIDGPWKLLAEYDVVGDGYNHDLGIEHTYVDSGLVNNLEYYYSVTAFNKPDRALNWPSLETSKRLNARTVVPGTAPPQKIGQVAVVPNPYRGDIKYRDYRPAWEKPEGSRQFWMEQDRRIQFIHLPARCKIKIYTLSGVLVNTINHDELGSNKGYQDWNLTSSVGQAIASGIYLFTVEDSRSHDVQVGKFVIIK